jgi:hypothetical protein
MQIDPLYKPLPAEPATLLTEGRLSEAVSALRDAENISAARARAWIDWHIAQDPMLRVQIETQQRAKRRRIFLWFLVVDAILVAGIIYYLWYSPR